MASKPIAYSLIKKESTAIVGKIAPDVPILIMFKDVSSFFIFLVSKSIFTKASNSFKTISILSVPIPVEITVMRLPL